MSSITNLLLEDSTFFKSEPKQLPYYQHVHDSAVRHTRTFLEDDENPVIDETRPNESKQVKDYRRKNHKQYTRSGFELLISKSSRAIRQCIQPTTSISDPLKEWLESKPFMYMGEAKGLLEYTLDILLRKGLENPNEVLLAFPYRKDGVIPDQGDETQNVSIQPKLIDFRDIRHLEGDCMSFKGGSVAIPRGDNFVEQDYYFSLDSEFWFLHYPVYKRDQGTNAKDNFKLEYENIVWYRHNSNESLVNFLPGEYSCSKNSDIEFLESYIRSYYSIADEAMHASSDDFAVQLRYSYPIPEIIPTQCQEVGCEDGYFKKDRTNPCKTCKGSGLQLWPGPFGQLISPKETSSTLEGNNNPSKPAITFHSPPIEYAEKSYKRRWDLLDKAYQTLGFRVYHGAGANASAEALKEWKQDELDRLQRIIQGLFHTVDRFLFQVESLLVVSPEARIRPVTIVPEDLSFLSVDQARAEAENALPQERLFAHKNYIKKKYKDDPIMLKANEALLTYTPFSLVDPEQLKILLAKDACTKQDMLKVHYAPFAINQIIEDQGSDLVLLDNKEIHVLIDQWLIDEGIIIPALPTDPVVPEEESALLQTVGGSQAAIGLNQAVADGKMTEAAAEKFMAKLFKIPIEEAKELIDVPQLEQQVDQAVETPN